MTNTANKPEESVPTSRSPFDDAVSPPSNPADAHAESEVRVPVTPKLGQDDLMHPYGMD